MQSNRSSARPYTRTIEVLVLCTANQCRSPMAEVLLRERLAGLGVDAVVSSAGELPGGVAASPGSVRAMAARGLDLSGHASRELTPSLVERADLVIAMGRRHLRNAVALCPDAFPRTYTLKELVRRGVAVGPRRPGQALDEWLASLHSGRTTSSLLGDDADDDVADPIGGPISLYEVTATELGQLLDRAVALAFAIADQRESA
jgi:protein-tyrosine phosphatase